MGENGTIWMPESASTMAPEVDALFYFVYWISVFIFFGVVSAMGFFVLMYRRRAAEEIPKKIKDSKVVEMASIVIPTFLVLVVFTWGFRVFVKLYTAPPDAYEIQVRAKQWVWEYEYPNGKKVFGDLVVPANRPVRLNMSSEDVLHSFFVPEFRVKMDVLPNRYTSVWFEATKADTFQVFCTEYCGSQHSAMIGKAIALRNTEFNTWLQESDNMTPAEQGALLYTQLNCVACHSNDGTVGAPYVGPTLRALAGSQRPFTDGTSAEADDNYLREAILQPMAKVVQGYPPAMPATYSSLEAAQVDALIAYIKSLE